MIIFSEIELDDDITLDNIQWLKNNSKPLSKVQELWRLTNKSRLRSLQKETTAVHDYKNNMWFCIKGNELIDYQPLYVYQMVNGEQYIVLKYFL